MNVPPEGAVTGHLDERLAAICCRHPVVGLAVGVVRDVEFTGGTPLLAVDSANGEVLIPLADEICVNVDLAARRIDVVLPEGLRELNRDS